jgi:hypothetical protein
VFVEVADVSFGKCSVNFALIRLTTPRYFPAELPKKVLQTKLDYRFFFIIKQATGERRAE